MGTAAHGGQVVLTEATRQLIGERLAPEVASAGWAATSSRTFPSRRSSTSSATRELPRDFPALRAVPAAAHNVPEQATLFVGRQTALRELAALVAEHRLVTVLGAGGVGKTRLASEVVPLVVDAFHDGVWMVELAKLRDGLAVAAEVARHAGHARRRRARPGGDDRRGAGDQALLLILDNCEHVLDEHRRSWSSD